MRATEAVIRGLKTYLTTAMAGIQITDDWPNPSQNLVFPSLTILSGEPKFTQQLNYVIGKGTTKDFKTKKYPIYKCMGSYDFVVKAHLWADSKPKRHELYEKFIAAMNPDFITSGLRLQLPDYYGEWVTFDMQNHVIVDNQENTQRSERRIIVDIVVNCRAIVTTADYLMEQIENSIETPESIPNPTSGGGTKII